LLSRIFEFDLEVWGINMALDLDGPGLSLVERGEFVAALVVEELWSGGHDEVDTESCDWPLSDQGFSGWERDAFNACLCPNIKTQKRKAGRREIAPAPLAPDLTSVRVVLDYFSDIISSGGFFSERHFVAQILEREQLTTKADIGAGVNSRKKGEIIRK
jgi:hypothetical protein